MALHWNLHLLLRSKTSLGRVVLSCLRWVLIIIGFWFVVSGWVQSVNKYISGKTSVSIVINESSTFMYPSITICPGFKSNAYNFILRQYKAKEEKGGPAPSDDDIQALINNASYARSDFFLSFRQDEFIETFSGNKEVQLLRQNRSSKIFWTQSTPSVAGKRATCFTYNPTNKGSPGRSSLDAIQLVMKYPDSLNGSTIAKLAWPLLSAIYIHDRDKFIFYIGPDLPSSTRISFAQLRFKQTTEITLGYSRFTSLSTKERPCVSDESYSFMKCYEKEMAQQRGCQKPWFYFPEFGIKKCENSSEIVNAWTEEKEQQELSTMERANKSGCHLPCTNSFYQLGYDYYDGLGRDAAAVNLFFKDFRFQYSEEYLICDMTCLIGEIGGNFGFFLGGSMLALYDVLYNWLGSSVFK